MTIFYKKNDNCKNKLTSTYVWIPIKTYFIDKWEATDEMYISMELGLTINCKLLDYIEAEISWNYLIRFVNSIVMDCCYCYYPTNWEYDSSYEGLWAICQCDLDRESVCMYVCVCMYVQASQWKEIWSLTNIYLLLHEDILFQAYVSELGNNFTQLTNAIIIEQYSFNMIDKVLTVEKKEKIH